MKDSETCFRATKSIESGVLTSSLGMRRVEKNVACGDENVKGETVEQEHECDV